MNRSLLALAGSTLVFGSASAFFWQEQRAGDERNAALETRVKELESKLAVAQSPPPPRLAAVAEPPAPLDDPAPPAKTPATLAAKVATPTVGTLRGVTGGAFMPAPPGVFRAMRMDKLMEDPEYRAAMRSQHRMMMSSRYPDLGDALRLQPEDVDKLLDLLTDQEIANMSSRPVFGENGQVDPAAMQEWSSKAQQRQRDNEAQLAGLLGDSGVQEWKEYQQTLGARMQVKQLRGIMEGSSDPIRPDQVQPLVAAMAAEQQRVMETQMRSLRSFGTGAAQQPVLAFNSVAPTRPPTAGNQVAMMEKSLEQTVQNNQRMHDAVAPYLSQRQLEQFDRYQNQQVEFQRANLRMMRASAEAEARGEVQPNGNGASVSANAVLVPMVTTTP